VAQPDLLSWPAFQEAEARTVAARAAWGEARRRYQRAPHGTRESRLRALEEASQEALRADLALAALKALS
jgi:hypothetical protein